MTTHDAQRQWMRELARVRSQVARLRSSRAPQDSAALDLAEDALQLLEALRAECAGLQQRCTDLEKRLTTRVEAGRRLLDTLPQPIVTTDAAGVILDANRAACTLLSRSRGKLTNDLLLHFAEDRSGFSTIVRELPQANKAIELRARFRPTDRAPFDAAVTVLRDPRVDPAEFLWVLSRDDQRSATT